MFTIDVSGQFVKSTGHNLDYQSIGHRSKNTIIYDMPSYNSIQKAAIANFCNFTQVKESVAAKVSRSLKDCEMPSH